MSIFFFVILSQAFNELLEPDETNDIEQKSYSKAKFMGKHCQGQKEVNLQSIAPTIRSEHHGNIEYRRLTIRECARIQTFPDDYEFII